MLSALVNWSLRRPRLILALGLASALIGVWQAPRLRLRLLPDAAPPRIVVRTQAPGLSPAEVEQVVTRPVEIALSGTSGVARQSSVSTQGLSMVSLELRPGLDKPPLRQAVAERLQGLAGRLPAVAEAPQMLPTLASGAPIRRIALTGPDRTALRRLADWTLRPRLLAVSGVAQVSVYGGDIERMEVQGRPGDLSDSDLSLLDLVRAAGGATSVAGAGFVDTPLQRVLVEPKAQAMSPDDVAAGQIQVPAGPPVRISDVADVHLAAAPAQGDALVDGRPGVVLFVRAQPDAAPLEVVRGVDATLAAARPALAARGVRVEVDVGGPADQIRAGLASGAVALGVAMGLLLLLMWAALRDGAALGVAVASLLVALLATVAAMSLLGLSFDAMSIGGLAVGLAVMIDDAVLDVGAVGARLARAGPGAVRAETVLRAALEVRGPVFVATLAAGAAVGALLLAPGVEGAVLRPLAATALIASAASLAVTATVTPALALLLARPVPRRPWGGLAELLRPLAGGLPVRWAAAALLLAAVAGAALAATLPFDPAPSFRSGRLRVEAQAAPSLSRSAAVDLMGRLAADLGRAPGVLHSAVRIGRDPTDQTADGLDVAQIELDLRPGLSAARQDAAESAARRTLAAFPGLQAQVTSRIYAGTTGEGAPFRVELSGPDDAELVRLGAATAQVLRQVAGGRDIRAPSAATTPTLRAQVDFHKLALYGLSAADVSDTVQAAFDGRRVGVIYDGYAPIDLVVTAARAGLDQPEAAKSLLLRSTSGVATPLGKVADVRLEEAPLRLEHRNGERVVAVEANPADADVHAFARRARAALAAQPPPPGVRRQIFESASGVALGLPAWGAVGAAAAGMALILLLAFRNPRTTLVVLAGDLIAVVGALAAVRLLHGRIDLGVLAGLAVVLGLSARNAILVISQLDRRVVSEGAPWSHATVAAVAAERLPVALLAGVMVLAAIVPLALVNNPASELLRAMSITVGGGIMIGGLLAAAVLPGLIVWAWRPLARPERGDR